MTVEEAAHALRIAPVSGLPACRQRDVAGVQPWRRALLRIDAAELNRWPELRRTAGAHAAPRGGGREAGEAEERLQRAPGDDERERERDAARILLDALTVKLDNALAARLV